MCEGPEQPAIYHSLGFLTLPMDLALCKLERSPRYGASSVAEGRQEVVLLLGVGPGEVKTSHHKGQVCYNGPRNGRILTRNPYKTLVVKPEPTTFETQT